MITAVDTNVLLDVFQADEEFGVASRSAMEACIDEGGLIACEVVWAEVSASFPTVERALHALRATTVGFSPLEPEAAAAAGLAWSEYRRRGGSRTRVVSDFLIGAHAAAFADRLLTRDRGFYRGYFPDLTIIDPSVT